MILPNPLPIQPPRATPSTQCMDGSLSGTPRAWLHLTMSRMAAVLASGSGGEKVMLPAFNMPKEGVTTAYRPL